MDEDEKDDIKEEKEYKGEEEEKEVLEEEKERKSGRTW